MALCRFAYLPRSSPTQILTTTNPVPPILSFPNYPYKFPNSSFSSLRKSSLPSLPLRSSHSSSSSASMEAPPDGYRRNVGICLMNADKKIFAASRLDIPNAWQMPQGGIDEGEDPKTAVIRELREETGVNSAEVVAEVPYWLTYDFPPHVREKLNIQWGTDWKGQAQKWFLLKFTGQDQEVNLLGDGTEKAEFGDWSWMTPEEIIEKAVDFKKPVYKEVLAVFAPFLQK
ncbi:nudix hydrolase 26, chloroplastic [Senna tora]|uniref:Nudix hydrolase 26, chloroplastic n=1 Tax=Senna tora TaxID=362788 RepID=A0A834SW26_9FABA|nr:nudix hydrolase 26, chloroplastic [Senna tora]